MMQKTERSAIDNLLSGILNGDPTNEQVIQFNEWIKDYKNELYFDRFKEMWHVSVDKEYIRVNTGLQNPGRLIEYIKRSRQRERVKRVTTWSIAAAASLLLIFTATHFITKQYNDSINSADFKMLSYSADSVKVELNNGQLVRRVKSEGSSITNLEDKIAANGDQPIAVQAKTYNTVSTPSGERVAMVLSDGTVVYLTSNSYLKYPSNFDKDKREVTLVGRAYFEVKKSKVPFIVNTSDMNIEVLGTSFDVESRNSGSSASVILVEGSVKVFAEGRSKVIFPDEQISLHRQTKEITVKNVDSRLLTMWKDGVLIVHGQSFQEVVESLSSWYGVKIVNRTNVSQYEKFNGRFDREDIEAAIKAVCISAAIKYRIEDGKLILENI
ncbi:MAG: hypothetical protein CVU13_11455 [Bacteroidetes bacterium HGW-Bacteroidetes-8]|jgi:ferric-dicitrate binding protein FerR (iron transport regulator)|nr:MAG: hypothetical protein CVU13_11455 [Bacteroidetes bacterium HGW-Bacteroidetes-8]